MLSLLTANPGKEFTPHHQQLPLTLLEELTFKFMIQLFMLQLLSQRLNIKLPNKNKENLTHPVKVKTQLLTPTTVKRETLENSLETLNSFN